MQGVKQSRKNYLVENKVKNEFNRNDHALKEYEDNKFNYPIKAQNQPIFENNKIKVISSELPSNYHQNDKNHFISTNHFTRKKSR